MPPVRHRSIRPWGGLFALLSGCADVDAAPPRPLPDYPEVAQPAALLWGGFGQAWGYNHRLNSLGDFVGPVSCDEAGCAAELVHSAASGSGSDTATWDTFHTWVRAPGVGFLPGASLVSFADDSAEGERLVRRDVIELPAEGLLAGDGPVTVLLAGFDLWATHDADKLEALSLGVGPAERVGDRIVFDLDASLTLDCDSPECDGARRGDRSVGYEWMVAWLVVAGEGLVVTEGDAALAYDWEDARHAAPLDGDDFALAPAIEGVRGLALGVPALRGISAVLDRDHHFVEWDSSIRGQAYADGVATLDLRLFFQQWNTSTAERLLSYTDDGAAALTADLALLQLDAGCAVSGTAGGALTWDADGGPADEDAIVREEVTAALPVACSAAMAAVYPAHAPPPARRVRPEG